MITRRRLVATSAAAGLALTSTSLTAGAQLGSKASRIMVGIAPGGIPDVVARLVVNQMKDYASPLIVENRPGAAERIALETLKNSPADGSVSMLTGSSPIAVLPHVYKKLGYSPKQDFTPVTTVCTFSLMLSIGPLVPESVRSLEDFVAWCRANPKQATFGTLGAGTPLHLTGFMLGRAAGFELTHVPYNGPAAVQDLLAGQIAATIYPVATTLPHVQSGRLRGLVITGSQRSVHLPAVPTMREAGYPTLEFVDWFGIFVPAKTPADVIDKFNHAVRQALTKDETREGLAKQAFEVAGSTPAEFAQRIESDTNRWGPIVMASGFRPEE